MKRDGHMDMKLRLVSWLMLYLPLLVVGAGVLLAKAERVGSDRIEAVGIVVAGVALLCLSGILILVVKINCPVCFGRVFGPARCSRHRDARRVMGSTRLGMVAQTIFRIDGLRCRFCGTRMRTAEGVPRRKRPVPSEIEVLEGLQAGRSFPVVSRRRPVLAKLPERRGRVQARGPAVHVGRVAKGVARVAR